MAVTHTTVGFKGTVDQIGEARRFSRLGPRGAVADANAWKVAPSAGDRTVTVASGSGQACGVYDSTSAVDTIGPFPANGSSGTGTRYDMIVARWKWTDPVTPVEFLVLTGTAGASGPDLSKLVRNPGTQYDLVLAVVRVAGGQGALSANDIFDVRVWGGVSGPAQLAPTAGGFYTVVDMPVGGQLITPGSPTLQRTATGWAWPREPQGVINRVSYNTRSHPDFGTVAGVQGLLLANTDQTDQYANAIVAWASLPVTLLDTRSLTVAFEATGLTNAGMNSYDVLVYVRPSGGTNEVAKRAGKQVPIANLPVDLTTILDELTLAAGSWVIEIAVVRRGGDSGLWLTNDNNARDRCRLTVRDGGASS